MSVRRISTLYISRVHGYIYPTLPENENVFLEEYFSILRQIKHGECFIIRKDQDNRCKRFNTQQRKFIQLNYQL